MANFRLRQLEKYRVGGTYDQMQLSLPRPVSPSGKIYQYSPNPEATPRLFQIGDAPEERSVAEEHQHRIRREPGPGQTICPYSGRMADDEDFTHLDDVEAVKKHIVWLAENDLQDYLNDFVKDFNRRQPRGGFITMKMNVKAKRRPKPLAIREDLLRSLECSVCSRSYGVYALALFCPDCGAPNIGLHFRREVQLVGEQITLADELEGQGRNELAYRLMGNAHEDVLTAFEATLKTLYRHLVREHLADQVEKLTAKNVIGNAFQNIERGRKLFEPLGIDPYNNLTEADLEHLRLNIQKRHVLGHNLGIADEHYATFAADHEPGETITLIGDDVRRFGALCCGVVEGLEDWLLLEPRRGDSS